jgi:hypothetical protein
MNIQDLSYTNKRCHIFRIIHQKHKPSFWVSNQRTPVECVRFIQMPWVSIWLTLKQHYWNVVNKILSQLHTNLFVPPGSTNNATSPNILQGYCPFVLHGSTYNATSPNILQEYYPFVPPGSTNNATTPNILQGSYPFVPPVSTNNATSPNILHGYCPRWNPYRGEWPLSVARNYLFKTSHLPQYLEAVSSNHNVRTCHGSV